MQRIHLGRIAGAVAAITMLAGLARHDAVALMAAEATRPDLTLHDGQMNVDLEISGISAILNSETGLASIPAFTSSCAFDQRSQQRSCRSHSRSDSAVTATSLALRSRTGVPQTDFDYATTDSVTIRTAVVNQWNDRRNHGKTISYRSTQKLSGVSRASAERTLNGADTTFRSTKWGNRFATNVEYVVTYSDISSANSSADPYPVSGVLTASSAHEFGAVAAPKRAFFNLLVYFDGTRTPEIYMNGKRYTLDLETGIATPKP